ncbi:hypothetical protein SOVF_137280 isoform A [Spinacia oleracea]|uniref:Uncharacterized protein isoform X2 n=1 Tax=Spinacia oleracea TaxID=3562 RepID=A0A9R0J8P3_SPIOL|nr:uncharacterized protein LOC110801863 isoform X2 [Spinacia oleracea]KNA11211.1 hypothetical protein SOVF_137280 isoform A [Spinacia oleracea]
MGSIKPEKKIKKMKKIKKRGHELVKMGEGAWGLFPFQRDDKCAIVEKNKDHVAGADRKAHKSKKARKNKSKENPPSSEPSMVMNDEPHAEDSLKRKKDKSKKAPKNKSKDNPPSSEPNIVVIANDEPDPDNSLKGKSKKAHKKKKDGKMQEVATDDVYQISSGVEDDSKGMKKWIKEFHDRRPGVKVLQEQIDNFITAHEEQEEQARRERETKLTEEGWTVVVHRKGGKRTTDPDSGVAVGSVAEAAVRDKLAKKKSKDVGLDFYRFQRKEAHRSEVMKLQSKFEEDKKRIQQIRAARKFKPY